MPGQASIAAIGQPACAEGSTGSDISVLKTAPASCKAGQNCAFQVTITNNSSSAYAGTLLVGDLMQLGGQPANGVALTSISPPLACDGPASALPFSCKAQTSLAAGESRVHTITVKVPAGSAAPVADGLNCFMAVDAAKASASSGDGIAAAMTGPGSGPGYSCVAFNVEPPATQCPGDLVKVGTQCKCPEGTRQGANYSCAEPIKQIVTPPKKCVSPLVGTYPDCNCPSDKPVYVNGQCKPRPVKQCEDPFVGKYPNCYCPSGTVLKSGTCVKPPTKRCESPLVGTYPNCVCPKGTRYIEGDCVKPPTKRCEAPFVGTYPNCVCPSGTVEKGGTCVKRVVECKSPLVGTYPDCACPKGTRYIEGDCVKPPTKRCEAPFVGTYPKCVCPSGTVLKDGTCVKRVVECKPPFLGTVPNCYCPKGTVQKGGTCIKVVEQKCQPPLIGTWPNCKQQPIACKQGQVLVNSKCVTKIPIVPILKLLVCPAPATGLKPNCKCPKGYDWTGARCVLQKVQDAPKLNLRNLPKLIQPNKGPVIN